MQEDLASIPNPTPVRPRSLPLSTATNTASADEFFAESAPRTRRNRPPVLSADTPPPNGTSLQAGSGSDLAETGFAGDLPVLGPDGLVTGPLHLLLDPALVQVDAAAARANAASADAAARPNAASANAAATPRASTSAATARSRPAPPPVAAPPVEPVFADDEDGFKSDLWHIKREMEADGERSWPVCYQQGSLWYRHGRSPYLVSHIASPALLTSGSNPRQRHDLFLWIPDLLTSKILVCSCGSPLSRHGECPSSHIEVRSRFWNRMERATGKDGLRPRPGLRPRDVPLPVHLPARHRLPRRQGPRLRKREEGFAQDVPRLGRAGHQPAPARPSKRVPRSVTSPAFALDAR